MNTGSLQDKLKGIRFSVTYKIAGDESFATAQAEELCYEQTVEFPRDLVPKGDIEDHIVGWIENVSEFESGSYRVDISFAIETAGNDLVQLMNVIFGNISIKPGIRVENFSLPKEMLEKFRGPRFGKVDFRKRLNVFDRPFICTALKPMGLSPGQLAEQAYAFAKGGLDIIKDDHGLTNQVFSPFEERVARCQEAVDRGNSESGNSCVYLPNITGPADQIAGRAEKAKALGAQGLLVCPGLVGLDTMRMIADDDSIGLPIMAHPSFTGSYVTCKENGLSHYTIYGQLMRLAGADMTVFPNYGGRFSFSKDECLEITSGCSVDMGPISPIIPAPGGGITTDRAKELVEIYGKDFVLLIGGGMHRRGKDLVENSRYFLDMIASL